MSTQKISINSTPHTKLEDLFCDFCSTKKITFKYKINNDFIFKCEGCGIMFSSFDREKSQELYNKAYYSSDNNNEGYSNYNAMSITHKSSFEKRLEFIERNYQKGGVVFDFGCALGHFCEVAKNRNWNVIGSDINTYAAQFVKKKYNINTFICDISHPPLKNDIADLICLYDLIEHTTYPRKALEAIKQILKNDGILHIVTPDSNCISAKILGRYWFHYKPKEHLFYFNKNNLKNLMEEIGFEILKIDSNVSYMTLQDIFLRLGSYLGPVSKYMIKILSMFNLNNYIIPIYVGNFEIVATPNKTIHYEKNNNQLKNLINANDIYICPNCNNNIDISAEKIICDNCSIVYGNDYGVPNFIGDIN